MTKHEVFPFEYDSWDQVDTEMFIFYGVVWLEQWGPFTKSQTHTSVVICFGEAVLETFKDANGPPVDKIKFKGVSA